MQLFANGIQRDMVELDLGLPVISFQTHLLDEPQAVLEALRPLELQLAPSLGLAFPEPAGLHWEAVLRTEEDIDGALASKKKKKSKEGFP